MSAFRSAGPAAAHLSLEEIAAMVDRTIDGADRERCLEHLSSCARCYELFAETARLVHGAEDDVEEVVGDASRTRPERPFEPRVLLGSWPRRLAWAGALAAAACLVLVVGTRLIDARGRPPELLPVADLAAPLVGSPASADALAELSDSRPWPVLLGPGMELGTEEQRSFRLGVRVFELEVALGSGGRQVAEEVTYRIESLLAGDELSATMSEFYSGPEGIRSGLVGGRPAGELLLLAREADALIGPDPRTDDPGFADPLWYAFGKWTASGQLAAATGNRSYFSGREHRRLLRRLQETPLPEEMAAELRSLARRLETDDRGKLDDVRASFDRLIAIGGGESSGLA